MRGGGGETGPKETAAEMGHSLLVLLAGNFVAIDVISHSEGIRVGSRPWRLVSLSTGEFACGHGQIGRAHV